MARPREHDPKEIRQAAVRCFWEHGYSNTAMSVLQAETGIDKKQLARDFGSKRGLFIAILDDYWNYLWTNLLSPMESEGAGVREIRTALRTISRRVEHDDGRFGCMVANTSLDSGAMNDPRIASAILVCFEKLERSYSLALRSAQKNGELNMSPSEIRRSARAMMAAHIAMAVLLRSGAPTPVLKDIAEHALSGLA